jgi:hypothetical protein
MLYTIILSLFYALKVDVAFKITIGFVIDSFVILKITSTLGR